MRHSQYIIEGNKFREANKDNFVVISAWGDWHSQVPKEMVGVFAGRGGRTASGGFPKETNYFLVPQSEYDTRNHFGFVIDEARHQRISALTTHF